MLTSRFLYNKVSSQWDEKIVGLKAPKLVCTGLISEDCDRMSIRRIQLEERAGVGNPSN